MQDRKINKIADDITLTMMLILVVVCDFGLMMLILVVVCDFGLL